MNKTIFVAGTALIALAGVAVAADAAATAETAVVKEISAEDQAKGLLKEAKAASDANFRGGFASYYNTDFEKAAEIYRKILAMDGVSGGTRLEAAKGLAETLLNIREEIDPEAEKIYEDLPKLAGLSDAEKRKAEWYRADYYKRSLQRDKALAYYRQEFAARVQANASLGERRDAARALCELLRVVEGDDVYYKGIFGEFKEYYSDEDRAGFCMGTGRKDEALRIYREMVADKNVAQINRLRLLRGNIRKNLSSLPFDEFKANFEKMLMPMLQADTNAWNGLVKEISGSGWGFGDAVRGTDYQDFLMDLNDQAPKGFKLAAADAFNIAMKGTKKDRKMAFAKLVLADETISASTRLSATTFLALDKAGKNGKSYVGAIDNWLKKNPAKDGKEKANAYLQAAVMAMKYQNEECARAAYSTYFSQLVPNEHRTMKCTFVPNAPKNIADILRSSFYKNAKKGVADRKYGDHLQFLLDTDAALTDRKIVEGKEGMPYPEIYSFCDEDGVKILIRVHVDKETINRHRMGYGGLPGYETYFVSGIDEAYDCFLVGSTDTHYEPAFVTQYDNGAGHRNFATSAGNLELSYLVEDESVTTLFSMSWKAFFNRIPQNGDEWSFEPIIWTQGGLSWGGSKSVHNRSSYGGLIFDNLTPENRTMIKRKLLPAARGVYDQAKSSRGGFVENWSDPELGDREFYLECVEPMIKRLDEAAGKIKFEMTDAEVNEVFDQAAETMFNINYKVAEMRREYLDEKRVRGE